MYPLLAGVRASQNFKIVFTYPKLDEGFVGQTLPSFRLVFHRGNSLKISNRIESSIIKHLAPATEYQIYVM